jgi:hypothetical protein
MLTRFYAPLFAMLHSWDETKEHESLATREEELIRETSSGAFAPLCNERPGAGGVRISPEPTAPFCSAMPSHAMLRQTTEVDPLRHSSSLPSGVACMLGRSNRKELS